MQKPKQGKHIWDKPRESFIRGNEASPSLPVLIQNLTATALKQKKTASCMEMKILYC